MNILFLNHNVARRGGTFFRAFHVARHLVALGHSVTLMTISADRKRGFTTELSGGVEIVHTPDLLGGVGRTGWDPWDTLNRIAWLRNREWNIVHAWDCRPAVILPALFARARSRAVNGKLVIDWCDWWGRGGTQAERPDSWFKRVYSPVETFFEEAFRAEADATTVAGEALRRRAIGLGADAGRMFVLPGGSDVEAVRPLDRAAARRELGLPEDGWIAAYMGTVPAPEVDVLLGSLHRARAAAPGLRFLAIGVSVSGSTARLREFAGARWADWMIDAGRVPLEKVGLHLAAADALLLTMRDSISNRARWPSKINDYLASGRPVVATRVGEIVEPVERHAAGILTACDPDAIADALLGLRADPALAEETGARGRRLAETELNWSVLVGNLARWYADVALGLVRGARPALASCSFANS